LLTLGLGAYVALHEIKQPTHEEQEERQKQVVDVPIDQVTEIAVTWPVTTATMKKIDGVWRLTEPMALRADESLVTRLLNMVDVLNAERVLGEGKAAALPLAEYGLEPPIGTVTLRAGTDATTLYFGEATALGGNRYVKRPESPTVFVVHDGIGQLLNQPIDAYRSTDVLAFDTWTVARIRVASPGASYTVEKRGEAWHLTAPLTDTADSGEAAALLNRVRNLRSERVIAADPKPEELTAWGLASPAATVTVELEGGKTIDALIGAPTTDTPDQRYAKSSDEPAVHAVAQVTLDELTRPPENLRSRSIVDYFATQVSKMQVTWQGATWTAEKFGDTWTVPEQSLALNSGKAEQFLWKLSDVKLSTFIEDRPADLARYGLDAPAGVVTIWTGADQSQEVRIGAPVEGGKGRYALIAARALVVEVPESITEVLSTAPASLTRDAAAPTEASTETSASANAEPVAPPATPAEPTPSAQPSAAQ
jgi:hypothetical protein